ncbi:Ditrans,polycis-undecaprenyl-diphosphate synthase ((2E,6E)-farnesyl-diphosphate specific) [Zhongshania aliphaticivorans]|uniref:Ditrans,polycis-undecaprenyl-diphosphate synthase ((2E,6E)-farnesyl-diphosphate specific) n=1 Tax=Zhongshania aliphaticivorans TaxID=1470434 RepID=A0A5S9MQ59_9GAMM|nr:polyprenyl diphosphate synthase [Zhongshania aliphaticivorans]CAA0078624.1 Ditrans,polycis-undecaprenyl-diphosphate synthase ((2E,6E)-farnesyl-diphosphate specific) [Zhongshania aliphaticivorans]CAA0086529.1 Ditrans,polycis-undecaprenyl-diphosphate synthase ((2E,6E)-farnesyl-diphosphate specific) [Zhongshania aliphaticivorans]
MAVSTRESAPISVPRHVAIIMDGNNRWAKQQGLKSSAGHRAGVEVIRPLLKKTRERGVEIVTLFAFSSENWQRPTLEVQALMRLFSSYLDSETKQLHADGVRMRFIGERDQFSAALRKQMDYSEQLTRFNRETQLVIAVDYGGQWDIVSAAKALAEKVKAGELATDEFSVELFDRHLALADVPKPDLCIRTAGEQRISNFLLWQLAYSELYFTDCFWPDFDAQELDKALAAYAQRDRRFGGRDSDNNEEAPE